jgi:hypothetical protein
MSKIDTNHLPSILTHSDARAVSCCTKRALYAIARRTPGGRGADIEYFYICLISKYTFLLFFYTLDNHLHID